MASNAVVATHEGLREVFDRRGREAGDGLDPPIQPLQVDVVVFFRPATETERSQ